MAKNRRNSGLLGPSYVKLKGRDTVNRTVYYLFYNERDSSFFCLVVFNEQRIAPVRHSQHADISELMTGGVFDGGANNLVWKFPFHGFIYAERQRSAAPGT